MMTCVLLPFACSQGLEHCLEIWSLVIIIAGPDRDIWPYDREPPGPGVYSIEESPRGDEVKSAHKILSPGGEI